MSFFKDYFPPASERARSVFYRSFITTWLIWNWKIVFTILFFRKEDFVGLTMVDYIEKKYLNICNGLICPLFVSLLFIFLLPLIDFYIFKYTEKRKRKKLDEKYAIGKLHNVGGDLYYNLMFEFENEKSKILKMESNLLKERGENVKKDNDLSQLKNQLERLQKEFSDINFKYQSLTARHNLGGVFEGRWTLEKTNPKNNQVTVEHINVKGNEYFLVNNGETLAYYLKLVDFDVEQTKFTFLKCTVHNNIHNPAICCELRIFNKRFEGYENGMAVTYTKDEYTKIDHEEQSKMLMRKKMLKDIEDDSAPPINV